MNVQTKPTPRPPRRRCASPASASRPTSVVEVLNPYTNAVVGTVPAARPEHVREAFAKATAFKPKLTRYERQQILQRTAETAARPQGGVRPPDHGGVRPVLEGLALRGEPRLRRLFLRRPADHQGRRRDLLLRHLARNGKQRKIYTTRTAAARRHLGDHAVQPPAQHGGHKLAPAIATNNRVVLKPTELTPLTALALADVLYEAGLPPEMLSVVTGNPVDHGRRHDHRSGRRPRHLHRLGAGSASTSPRRPATGASCSSSAATIR